MTDFHWHLVIVWWQVSLSIGILGSMVAGYYFRGKCFEYSERMNRGCRMLDKGLIEEAREILSDH